MPTQKFLDIVSIADIDAEERVDDSLEEIMKLKFGQKSYLKISKLNFDQDFELNCWWRLWEWDMVILLKLKFDWDSEGKFGMTFGMN